MSKLALLLVLVILLPAYVLAADIGYIVKNPAYPETAIINALNEMKLSMNLSYQLIDDSKIPSVNFSQYKLIIVSEDINNAPVNSYKSVVVDESYYENWSAVISSVGSSQPLKAYKLNHSITNYTSGEFVAYTQARHDGISIPYYYLSGRKYNSTSVVTTDNSTSGLGEFVIARKENPRRVFFGITESDFWTSESEQLFKNSVLWTLSGEDKDRDGFYTDEDCNDNNASINPGATEICDGIDNNCVNGIDEGVQTTFYEDSDDDSYGNASSSIDACSPPSGYATDNTDCDDANNQIYQVLTGYQDNDGDTYTVGEQQSICSGASLPQRYIDTQNAEDCNDNDASINPDSEEIPYNSIDENCDGLDLADVDNDGYCLANYSISNKTIQCNLETSLTGTDCNDNNVGIHPNAIELIDNINQNCVNDAPIVQKINKITVQETETATIEVIVSDPEGDELNYSINDYSRFSQNGNIFTWETTHKDYGNYFFTITVSDGSLESQIEVEVKVTSLNQAPICDEIPVLEWQEDTEAELNLSIYCYDPDGEAIRFYFNETSEDKNITLESLDSETGIAEFSVEENWNGEDWIIFKVSDGKDYTLTNKIILRVLPVNDTPVFTGKIENITWNEDSNLINYINLNNYFSDVDNDSLSYDVGGDYFVDINIENGLVSFYPQKDWYGEENVVFSATDGVETTYSNAVVLTVLDMNEPPEFKEMECETEILEDSEENCLLNVTDFENDSISFNVENENKLNCKIEGDKIIYQGFKDYNGNASCLIRARDKDGYADYTLNVVITPINDAPVITSYSPKDNPKLMENTNQLFSVIAEDVDGDVLDINWFLDLMKVGSGRSYLFNKEKGDYEVKVEVSDDIENVTKTWDVFVGDISDFTCQEVGGDICSEKELCRAENLLGVKDTTNCCSITCSPSFSKTERCKNLSGSVEVEIEKPDEDEEFMAGDIIDVKVDVSNREENDHKFKVNAYLYDLTKDRKVEDDDDSVRIDKEDTETVKFEFKVEEDIDEDKNYAIFVSAIDQDGEFCNEDYVEINIEREEEVVIKEFNMPEIVKCENSFDIEAKVKNIGRDGEENVYVVIENQELGIREKSEEFKLEEYEEDDEAVKYFTIKNPQNISGSHIIKASVFFNGESNSQEKEIVFEECKKIEVTKEEIGKIFLEGKTEGKEVKEQNNKKLIILLLISMFFVLIAITFLFYLIFKARKSI